MNNFSDNLYMKPCIRFGNSGSANYNDERNKVRSGKVGYHAQYQSEITAPVRFVVIYLS